MKMKRILSLAVAAVMTVGLLAGCGGGSSSSNSGSAAPAASGSAAPAEKVELNVIAAQYGTKTADWWAGQGAVNLRTVFNRVGRRLPKDLGYAHLDAVLDAIGARLLGMIPADADLPFSAATGNIAARLCGESCPLLAVYRP